MGWLREQQLKCVSFLIPSMVFRVFNQLHNIFWQLHPIELLELLIPGLGLRLMQFWVRYLTLFCLFSVVESSQWFCMARFHKNIQLILQFLKAPFLVQHLSCYTLMTFLMILSVILLFMLMILLSNLSVIRHLICGNNWNWLLNLNLIYQHCRVGRR